MSKNFIISEINKKDSGNVMQYFYLNRSNPKFRNNSSASWFKNFGIYQKFINVEIDVVIIYSSPITYKFKNLPQDFVRLLKNPGKCKTKEFSLKYQTCSASESMEIRISWKYGGCNEHVLRFQNFGSGETGLSPTAARAILCSSGQRFVSIPEDRHRPLLGSFAFCFHL